MPGGGSSKGERGPGSEGMQAPALDNAYLPSGRVAATAASIEG